MLPDLLVQRLLAEAEPITELRYDPARVGAITHVLRRLPPDELRELPSPKGRWDFLESARSYLSGLTDREELLVAMGTCGASRTTRSRLTHVCRSIGAERSVQISPRLQTLLDDVVQSRNREALVVHNHPPFWFRRLLATLGTWRPTPSTADRELAFAYEARSFVSQLSAWGHHGRVRWYLVDEQEINEFRMPSLERLGAMLQWLAAENEHERR